MTTEDIVNKFRDMMINVPINDNELYEKFRTMSIFPTNEDIHRKRTPHLDANIVTGAYMSVDHYLNTQFRLLRESLVHGLWESIQKYRRDGDACEFQIPIYHDVEFVSTKATAFSLLHTARFDRARLSHVDWSESDRLKPGSLLCLSSDNFETFFFATIVHSSEHQQNLANEGKFDLQILGSYADFYLQLGNSKFVAIESITYYEAVKHALRVLQMHTKDTFPMQRFIVRSNFDKNTPKFITGLEEFSLTCLVRRGRQDYDRFTSVTLDSLDASDCEDIGFDTAQAKAFKAALSKQFIVIQGPPGTGKSYIAERIVTSQLKNKRIWAAPQYDDNTYTTDFRASNAKIPIVVMAYKNIALDYLLEKLLTGSRGDLKVVRFGHTENEAVKPCLVRNLMERRRAKPDQRQIECQNELSKIVKEVAKLGPKIHRVSSGQMLLATEIIDRMGEDEIYPQFMQLKQKYGLSFRQTVARWLGLKSYESDEDTKDLVDEARYVLEQNFRHEYQRTDIQRANARELERRMRRAMVIDNDDWEDSSTTAEGYMPTAVSEDGIKKLKNFMHPRDIQKLKEILELEQILKQDRCIVKKKGDIMDWPMDERRRQYNNWVQMQLACYKDRFKFLTTRYEELRQRLFEYRNVAMYEAAKHADVIGLTITGAAKYKSVIEMLKPKHAIIEEAAEILEPYLVCSLTKSMEQVILIGDHKQLRPLISDSKKLKDLGFETSLFERMVNNDMEIHTLETQHRMRPDIASLLRPYIYDPLYDGQSVMNYSDVVDMRGKNMYFFEGMGEERRDKQARSNITNEGEARFALELVRFFLLRGVSPQRISVLAAYRGQVDLIRKKMRQYHPNYTFMRKEWNEERGYDEWLPKFHLSTIDSYQGEENDIMIVSFVRTGDNIGFLGQDNRVNVALSRAKHGLYCLGNFSKYAEQSGFWRSIVDKLQETNSIGPGTVGGCECRPVEMYDAADFQRQNDFSVNKDCICGQGPRHLSERELNEDYDYDY